MQLFTLVDSGQLIDVLKFDCYRPLLFNTGLFLVLFAVFIVVYQLLSRYRIAKQIFVIAFSLYFYYKSSAEYCWILLGVCVSDYLLGLIMGRCKERWQKRSIVMLNVVINVGMLAYFKYFNLLYETVADMAGKPFEPLDIILPAGISFYTFRSISYIVDIYRGVLNPCRNFLSYTFYLTFFPPLLAGPVVRAKDMLPQVDVNPVATKSMIGEGFFLIMTGLIKKVVIADFISQNFVDRIFDNPSLYSGFENLMGMYGFTIQLYCDFSGYSDMAIGIALLLGYRFMDNFRAPFKAQNPTEFWHRWHISLSTWLRDYIYIPLGGNRCSKLRHNINLMSTMLIGGLWHGASWMYLIWGGLQGAFLIIHKALRSVMRLHGGAGRNQWWKRVGNIFITFNLIAVSFVFFRADSLATVSDMASQVFGNFHLSVAMQFVEGYMLVVVAIAAGYMMHFAPSAWTDRLKSRYGGLPMLLQAIILSAVLFLIIQTRQSDIMPFIYLQY